MDPTVEWSPSVAGARTDYFGTRDRRLTEPRRLVQNQRTVFGREDVKCVGRWRG